MGWRPPSKIARVCGGRTTVNEATVRVAMLVDNPRPEPHFSEGRSRFEPRVIMLGNAVHDPAARLIHAWPDRV